MIESVNFMCLLSIVRRSLANDSATKDDDMNKEIEQFDIDWQMFETKCEEAFPGLKVTEKADWYIVSETNLMVNPIFKDFNNLKAEFLINEWMEGASKEGKRKLMEHWKMIDDGWVPFDGDDYYGGQGEGGEEEEAIVEPSVRIVYEIDPLLDFRSSKRENYGSLVHVEMQELSRQS